MARAVRRGAALRRWGPALRRGKGHQIHAVMEQGKHHGDERRLLAAVQGLGRGENRRRLVGERAAQPNAARAVEEMLERRRHVAEASRASEDETSALDE